MRFVPFSYFCTCWKVRPSFSPSFSWLIPSIRRRMRTREPTYLSVGFGDFFAIICIGPHNVRLEEVQSGSEMAKQGKVAPTEITSQRRQPVIKAQQRFY